MESRDEVTRRQVFRQAAEYPSHALESLRLKTFEDWPKALNQKPEQLADAGFFYTGMSDRVVCFSCGGGLSAWERHDVPWEQHALYYGDKCKYVKLMKGANYHEEVIAKLAAARIEKENEEEKKTSANGSDGSTLSAPSNSLVGESGIHRVNDCKICYENECNSVFIPCGHIIACVKCALAMTACPVCKNQFTDVFKVYFA